MRCRGAKIRAAYTWGGRRLCGCSKPEGFLEEAILEAALGCNQGPPVPSSGHSRAIVQKQDQLRLNDHSMLHGLGAFLSHLAASLGGFGNS